MDKIIKYFLSGTILLTICALLFNSQATLPFFPKSDDPSADSLLEDTLKNVKAQGPQFKLKNDPAYPSGDLKTSEGIQLRQPANLKSDVVFDPITRQYIFTNKVGKVDYRRSSNMSIKEFQKYEMRRTVHNYWETQANGGRSSDQRGFRPSFNFGGQAFDKIFGSNTINIVPTGQAELIFKVDINSNNNPSVSENMRTVPSFDFEEKIQMNVAGTIGDRLKLGITYNTDATFDFENKTKLEYTGDEDEIVKKVEAGDVTMPLSGTLIQGSQSLFGIKTDLQFGKLYVTTVLSQQKGQSQELMVQGGAQVTDFNVTADEYEANKHFFLAHTFEDGYDRAHAYLPRITSNIKITRIELWVTNRKGNFEVFRDLVAFADLGEPKSGNLSNPNDVHVVPGVNYADNKSNDLYEKVKQPVRYSKVDLSALDNIPGLTLKQSKDYEKLGTARKLGDNEYSFNEALGYISLNSALSANEILAVAFEYTENGVLHKVGQFASDNPDSKQPLTLKLIKGINLSPSSKTWGLMMKNIYSLNAYDVSPNEFYLYILYHDDNQGTDINYLPEEVGKSKMLLLSLFDLDKVNSQFQPQPDGVFDFLDKVTIDRKYGRIIFPTLQPFGNELAAKLKNLKIADSSRYLYHELYDSTLTKAKLVAQKNKFKLKGSYKSSSSSEIYLNAMNIPVGSVKVTSGGIELREGNDYIVDYTMGTVKILNQGYLNSGQPIKVSLENNSMFNVQTKTLIGTHLDYKFSDDFNLGGTIMHLNERPLTKKVNIGDEPISNTIWGLNSSYKKNSQFLTTLIDKLPLLQTKEPSSITLTGEFAQLIPGTSKAIGKNGVAYIDDFEGSETQIDLTLPQGWKLSSAPVNSDPNLFKYNSSKTGVESSFDRAKLSWYYIDPIFTTVGSLTPNNIKNNPNLRSSNYVRQVLEQELFPNRDPQYNQTNYLTVMNLTYYPYLKGPYNYDLNLDNRGYLNNPEKRWGGIMRDIPYPDFEASNIEYIEFWLMDPYVDEDSTNTTGGDLYFNLGEISEDVLKDGKMAFEQGLPTSGTDIPQVESSPFGRVTTKQPVARVFSTEPTALAWQDVGLDGLSDTAEENYFSTYVNELKNKVSDTAKEYGKLVNDPSSDDFHYYKDPTYDQDNTGIIDRYMDYNGMEKNSQGANNSGEVAQSYSTPDMEDIDGDNTMNENESFFEYKVSLKPGQMRIGENYLTDVRTVNDITLPNNHKTSVKWFQFKIPIKDGKKVGDIAGFESIRFMRMYLTGFEKKTTFRFAKLELVRGEWRKFDGSMIQAGESDTRQSAIPDFDIQAVNIEENSKKLPVNYVLPPGIDRVIDPSQEQLRQLNEQSMVLKVNNLPDGDARAAFKAVSFDMRQYKHLQMFAHCEPITGQVLKNHDLSVFIRIGTDYTDNYYEYEVPMKVTDISKIPVNDPDSVWHPNDNSFNIVLDLFQQLKQKRNDLGISLLKSYPGYDGKNIIRIRGNPTLSDIRAIMIGVRNPAASDKDNPYPIPNDGLAKSAEIWVNELRLTDFSDKGGWAANARAQIKLADFGNVRISGSTMKPGFGSIEKKVNDREKVETNTIDVATDFELGKFFPEKAQVKIPMFASYSKTVISPQYNPYDPDIPLQAAIDNAIKMHASADSIAKLKSDAQDFTERRSINFTNVKVNKTGKKPHFYDPANFSVSYGYNDIFSHTPLIEYNKSNHYEGGFNYIYNLRPKNVTPFKRIKFLNNKMLRLFSDFNFYYLPKSVSFRTNMDRDHREMKLRDISNQGLKIDPTVERNFTWGRYYDVKFDLTRSLSVDFSAASMNRIDEVGLDSNNVDDVNKYKQLSVWQQIMKGGTPTNYNQTINVNYTVPINKLPLLDWTSLNARYSGYYEWQYQPPFSDSAKNVHNLGNNIKNSGNLQLNANASFTTIYNKISFLKDLQRQGKNKGKEKPKKTVTFVKKYYSLKAGEPKSISHKLGTSEVTIKVVDDDGSDVKGKLEVINNNRVTFTPEKDASNVTVTVEGKVEAGQDPLEIILRTGGKILTGIKSVTARYTVTNGTTVPGYFTTRSKESEFFGSTLNHGNIVPGVPFILGLQDTSIISRLAGYGSLTTDVLFNSAVLFAKTTNFTLQMTIEPIDGLKIDLTANHSRSDNSSQNYNSRSDTINHYNIDNYSLQKPIKSGNFSMTVISLGTFEKLTKNDGYNSKVFSDFDKNRYLIKTRIDSFDCQHYTQSGFRAELATFVNNGKLNDTLGNGIKSQQVLIPAFLATYAGYGVNKVPISLIPSIKYMRPNWRVTYDGLTSIPFIDNYFRSVTLSHAYTSNYNIGSFTSNLDYKPERDGFSYVRDELNTNFLPAYDVDMVSINEQFTPLFGIDMTWKNNLTSRFEYKKLRTLVFSLKSYSLSESRSNEYVIGLGYRFEEVPLKFITLSGSSTNVKSDLNLRGDLSIKNDYTVLRKFDEGSQPINAIRTMSLSITADYALSDKLNVNLFYKRDLNDTQGSYLNTNTQIGFSIRFTLTQ